MPTITLNKNTLQKLTGKKLSDKALEENLTALGIDVKAVLETEVEVEVNPNRPDWLSEQGIGRSLASFAGNKRGLRKYNVKRAGYKVIVEKSVSNVRPFTACAVVKNLKFDEEKIREIIQAQEKLHVTFCRKRKKAAIGIYPMEKISWPITYTAQKPNEISFVPLESNRELSANQILKQHPAGQEYAYLLEGKTSYPIFIDAKGQILSMPPIINSHTTGKVTEQTKDVFIECSGFDMYTLTTLINIITAMLIDMGGQAYAIEVKYGKKKIVTPELEPKAIKLDPVYAQERLGIKLKPPEIKKCLEKMGFGVKGNNILVPAYRADVMHQIDLVEDIAIAYGYDKIGSEVPDVATIASEDKFYQFKEKISNLLVGLGLLESQTYSLSSEHVQNNLMSTKFDIIELANALTVDYSCLRAWLMPGMLEVLKLNRHHEFPQKMFTIGSIFKKNPKTETGIEEPVSLSIVNSHSKSDYTEIKQIVEYLFRVLKLDVAFEEKDLPSFVPGRAVKIMLKGKEIGIIGEIHPEVLTNFTLEMPVSAAEISLTDVFLALE